MHRIGRAWILVLALLAAGCGIHPVPPIGLPFDPRPPLPPSRLTVTVKTSWPAIRGAVDAAIPRCGGIPGKDACLGTEQSGNFIIQREEAWEGIPVWVAGRQMGVKGSAWRWNDVSMGIANNTLTASLPIFYHAKLGIAGGGFASCGYDEDARLIYVSVSGPLSFSPDWYFDPRLSANVRPDNLCRVTIFNINIQPFLSRLMEGALQSAANKATDQIRAQTNVRARAADVWAQLSQPIALSDNIWLQLQPSAAFAGPFGLTDGGQNLALPVAVQASPRIILGSPPLSWPNPLPRLQQGTLDPEFSIYLEANAKYSELATRLKQYFAGKKFTLGPRWPANRLRFRVTDVEVSGGGNRLLVALLVQGSANGTLYLTGTPVLVNSTRNVGGTLVLRDVDFTAETRNWLVQAGNIIFHNNIQQKLQQAAHLDISDRLQFVYSRLNAALNRDLPGGAKMRGRLTKFGPGDIWAGPTGLEARYRVGGEVEVIIPPL
jgi:hypothetical protein